jgi:hypothetical protein
MTTIKLEGKEYQIDIEQAKKLNLLKEKNDRVKNWEEFKEKYCHGFGYFYKENEDETLSTSFLVLTDEQLTPHEVKALASFSKLLKLRRDWIGEWEPDWKQLNEKCILYRSKNEVCACSVITAGSALSFPTKKMANEFLETFHDLIEDAKILI